MTWNRRNDVAERSEADTRIRVYLVQVRVERVEGFAEAAVDDLTIYARKPRRTAS